MGTKEKSKVLRYFNVIAAALLTLLYLTGYIPPSERFNLWISIFIIPFAMVANTVLLVNSAVLRRRSGLFYLLPMIVGVPYMVSTVGIKGYFQKSITKSPQFTLLSYNVSNFRLKQSDKADDTTKVSILHDLVLNPTTDIQCYQEFINFPWSHDGNLVRRLQELGRHFYFSMEPEAEHTKHSRVGTLIVSRFPIIASGDILEDENGFNRVSFVDVIIESDTVRIINAHLHSMGLGRFDPRTQSQIRDVGRATKTILSKLKEGVFERSKQAEELTRFVKSTPYPLVCAGDFNDMPYSYTYRFLKKSMKNAFEESGTGFGFTYNGGTLRVLRIDNQFYRGEIQSVDFETRYDIPYTDHFPVQGTFQVKRNP